MKNKSGFTLVELIISMGIMTILITVLAQVFGSILSMRQKNEAVSVLAQDSRFVVARIAYDVARATSITSPTIGNPGPTLTLIIDGHNYVYTLQNNKLTLSIDAGAQNIINSHATNISTLTFTQNNPVGGYLNVQADLTLIPTMIQPGVHNDNRRVITTFVTR